MTFKIIHRRLVDLMAAEGSPEIGDYEPDDVFDTHGLYVDIADTVESLTDAAFREAAMERLQMPEMFRTDGGRG